MLNASEIDLKQADHFRFKELNGHYLLTNDMGDYAFLPAEDFTKLVTGRLQPDERTYRELGEKGFAKNGARREMAVQQLRFRYQYLGVGPVLHIVIPTLRCNLSCVYCHASAVGAREPGYDMNAETAKRVVDTILQAPARNLTLEFQGGEPLLNWEIVRFIIEYGRERATVENKDLTFLVVTNLTTMDEEKLSFLVKNKVAICTSLDGHELLHNKNRGGYGKVRKALKHVMQVYKEQCDARLPSALVTVTRDSLAYPREIVDEYIECGLPGLFVRPLNPMGVARSARKRIDYSVEEYMVFYRAVLDHILGLNKAGTPFFEQMAGIFLTKILCGHDPNFMDLRSPCGAGIGQLAYTHNGDVYTCDEGRMLSTDGDTTFKLGNVMTQEYHELIDHPVVRSLCVASCMEGIPTCADCAYKPYCGVCPVYNYVEYGDICQKGLDNRRCRMNMGILDTLFTKLQSKEDSEALHAWAR